MRAALITVVLFCITSMVIAADPPATETQPTAAATAPAAAATAPAEAVPAPVPALPPVSYYKQIWPVVQRQCQGCHQPAKRGGKLVMTSYEEFKSGGDVGEAFVAGKPDESLVVKYLTGALEPRMPKDLDPLPPEQIELFRRWIAEGALNDTPAGSQAQSFSMDSPPTYEEAPVISALAYSPDGQMLAVSGYHEVLLHKPDGSGVLGRLVGLAQRINSIVYSPDGKYLFAAGGSPGRFGEIQIWDLEEKRLRRAITVGYDSVYGVSVSPDGEKLAVGCADNSARIFEVDTGKELLDLKHHTDWVLGTTFSNDNKFIITVSRDNASKLSEADTGSLIDDVSKIRLPLFCLVGHPKADQYLVAGEEGIPRLYKMHRTQTRGITDEDTNMIRQFDKQTGPTFCIALSADAETMAVGGRSGEARVYKMADGSMLANFGGHNGSVFAVTLSPDGKQLATGGLDGKVRVFDVPAQKLIKDFVPVPLKEKKVADATAN